MIIVSGLVALFWLLAISFGNASPYSIIYYWFAPQITLVFLGTLIYNKVKSAMLVAQKKSVNPTELIKESIRDRLEDMRLSVIGENTEVTKLIVHGETLLHRAATLHERLSARARDTEAPEYIHKGVTQSKTAIDKIKQELRRLKTFKSKAEAFFAEVRMRSSVIDQPLADMAMLQELTELDEAAVELQDRAIGVVESAVASIEGAFGQIIDWKHSLTEVGIHMAIAAANTGSVGHDIVMMEKAIDEVTKLELPKFEA